MVKQERPSVEKPETPFGFTAIVQEWLEDAGGSEKVIDSLTKAFNPVEHVALWDSRAVRKPQYRQSFLKAFRSKNKAALIPLMLVFWLTLRMDAKVKTVFISSHSFAHWSALAPSLNRKRKIIYVHTPARYLWVPEIDSRGQGLLAKAAIPPLRWLDSKATKLAKSATYVANSYFIRDRIESCWGLNSLVVYPPVDVEYMASPPSKESLSPQELALTKSIGSKQFLLSAGRLVAYKQVDQAIRLAATASLPLVVVGDGPDLPRLSKIAAQYGTMVHFLGKVSREFLRVLYAEALCLVFPGIEDFGIVPVESMAAGTPVIANSIGGASESVVHLETGFLTDFSSLVEIVDWIKAISSTDMASACKERASLFSENAFVEKILQLSAS